MRSIILLFAGAFLILIPYGSHAAENGFYLGGAVGEAHTRDKIGLDDLFDDDDSSYKVIGGWRPFDWFAVEGNYFNLGEVSLRQNIPDLSPFKLRQRGFGFFGVFMLELGRFDVFGKSGIVRSSADFSTNSIAGPLSWTDRDTDFAWGFGAQARFGRVATRVEWERMEISNGGTFKRPKAISFGVTWMFSDD